MRRRSRTPEDSEQEINLAPIMNMVVILIPLLLLSIVFLRVGVINVSAPSLTLNKSSTITPEQPLNLTVAIGARGFHIATSSADLEPVTGCPTPGPTICTKDGKEAEWAELDQGLDTYDWAALYNQLVQIKKQHDGETTINITADPDVPYAAIVRVMDVARFRLASDTYEQPSEFWSARYATSGDRYAALFPDPVLNIAR